YFVGTVFGNPLAGRIGSYSQLEPFQGEMIVSKQDVIPFISKDSMKIRNEQKKIVTIYDYPINEDKNFSIKAEVYAENDQVMYKDVNSGTILNNLFELSQKADANTNELLTTLKEDGITASNPYHARLVCEKDKDKAQNLENKEDGKNYGVSFVLEEDQSAQEYATFMWLTIFTVSFGLLLIVFLKKLKKLTHGAEDHEHEIKDNEPFELADPDINN